MVTLGRGRHSREDTKGVFCDAGNGLYFDLGGGYMVAHIRKNSSNYLQFCGLCYTKATAHFHGIFCSMSFLVVELCSFSLLSI